MSEYRLTIRGVDAAIADQLRDYASAHGLTLGECVTEAVAAWLAEQVAQEEVAEGLDAIQEGLSAQRDLLQQFIERVGAAA